MRAMYLQEPQDEQQPYTGPDRRVATYLTEAQINAIAQRAADVALERVYTAVGRNVVTKVLWILGAGALALAYLKPEILRPLK